MQPINPHRNRISVMGIGVFGNQHGTDVLEHTIAAWASFSQAPQLGLWKDSPTTSRVWEPSNSVIHTPLQEEIGRFDLQSCPSCS